MKVLGAVVVCGLAALARAESPKLDPFAYPHGLPRQAYVGLGASSVTPELVAAHAPAALAPALSRQIAAQLDIRGVGPGQLTPKGDRLFYASALTGTQQVWRQDGPDKFPHLLTGGEDATALRGIAPDGSFVVVSRDRGGAENPGLYLMDPDGGPLRALYQKAEVQASLAFIADDARSLYFRANDRSPDAFAIYRFDIQTGAIELVFDRPGVWSIADHRPGEWLMTKATGSSSTEVYRYDLAHQTLTPVLGQNETEDYDVAYGAHPGELLVRTDKLGEFARLYTFDGHALTPIGAEVPHDTDDFRIDDARARIYVMINDGGYKRLTVLDARTYKPIAVPAIADAESVSVTTISHDGRFAQLEVVGSKRPQMTYVLDWRSRKLTTWRPIQTPEVDVSKFVTAALETYPARDGVAIPMFVRRPPRCATAATPCPVVVSFHGGPEFQVTAEFSAWGQLMVEHGFIVVEPNVRGSTGYGKAWLHADDGAKRLDVITDIEDCAVYIKKTWRKGGVAPKVGVTGASYGGYAVLMAMSLYAGAYDAGVDEVGIANLVTFLANTAPYRRILRISEYGDPVKDKLALEKLSPINYVDRIKAPLLIIQGVNDPRVPVGEALQIYDALQARKIDSQLILFPDEGHGASKRENIIQQVGHELAFFEKHLK